MEKGIERPQTLETMDPLLTERLLVTALVE